MNMNPVLFKFLYYFLSFTWGIITNICGAIMALVMLVTGHKPKRCGGSIYFECGNGWGGFSYGIFFIISKNEPLILKAHEYGHSLQNCVFGPFMLFIVCLPSTTRYWSRRIQEKRGRHPKKGYDDIWFEGQATKLGKRFLMKYYLGKNRQEHELLNN